MPKNYMEDIVEHLLPTVMGKYKNICKCEKCIEDIKAVALNKLKPLYVVTAEGSVFLKINETNVQFTTDVINELIRAIEIVAKNPKHNL